MNECYNSQLFEKITPNFSDVLRMSIIQNLFPFTIHQGKNKQVPEEILRTYELITLELSKKIQQIAEKKAKKENREVTEELLIEVLEEIQNSSF